MSDAINPVIETYSRLAGAYDDEKNQTSCWAKASAEALGRIVVRDDYRVVADIGCGTGRSLAVLASHAPKDVQFVGVEPADHMRERARVLLAERSNVRVVSGSFEATGLAADSVDYIYSIMAFHWTTDLQRSVQELARILRPGGEMDHIFIGRWNGREFIKKTSPIFLKYMGPAVLLQSASLRKQLTRDEATSLFCGAFSADTVLVDETYTTYYDSLEGHWGWWVRIEGQFFEIAPDDKARCDQDVKAALAELATEDGIPYTLHALHVRLRRRTDAER